MVEHNERETKKKKGKQRDEKNKSR